MSDYLILRSAIIHTPTQVFEGDLVLQKGKIIQITKHVVTTKITNEIDCRGLDILPGLIDTHVHLRDPGMTAKEDFETGTSAAAAGGVTTIFDMPNTKPPTVNQITLTQKRELAHKKAKVNYAFWLGATHTNLKELNHFQNIAGIKVFVGSSTGNLLLNRPQDLEYLFANTKHLIAIHAEDETTIQTNATKFKGQNQPALHSQIRSPEAEKKAVIQVLELAKKYGTRVHLCHISTRESVDLLRQYTLPNVTAEVSMHHLFLNQNAYTQWGNFVKINPPLRTAQDNAVLLQALKNGIIQTIATDHAPHLKSEKEQNYAQAPGGMPMLELTLPLLLDQVHQGKITLSEVIKWTSQNPAKLFNLTHKGKIEIGADADLVMVNLKQVQTIQNQKLFTKCRWTPFDGRKLMGKVVSTVVNGKVVFANEQIKTGVFGQEVYR